MVYICAFQVHRNPPCPDLTQRKSTTADAKRTTKLGYCPKCSAVCEGGRGTAQTKSGKQQAITVDAWVHYQSEPCSACAAAREAVEKKP